MDTKRRALPPWLLLGAGFVVAADIRVAAPLLPAIADDFGTSVGVAGLTVAVYGLSYAAGQMLYGRLGDRVGKVRVIRAVLLLFALGTGLCAVSPNLPVLLALRLLTGAFAAGVIPMSLAWFGDTVVDYTARRKQIGVFLSVIVSGQVFGQALGGILAGLLSWRAIFIVLGTVAALITLAMWRYHAPGGSGVRPARRGHFRAIFMSDRPLFLLTVTETFFFLGSFAFAGSELVETRGASYPLVGSLLALFAVGSLVTSKGLARVGARAPDALRVASGGCVVAAGFALLATTPGPMLFGVAVFVLGLGLTFAHSTLQTRATEVSPDTRGAAVSLFAGIGNVGAALGTFAAGAVVDGLGYGALFGTAAVGILVVAGAAVRWLGPHVRLPAGPPASGGDAAARSAA